MTDFGNHKPNNRIYDDYLRQKRNLAIAFVAGYMLCAAVIIALLRLS